MPIRGSAVQFFQDHGGPDTEHGDYISWPGTATGFPVLGATGHLTQDEYEALGHIVKFHSRRFCLWDPGEKKAFDDVKNHIESGLYAERLRINRWSDEHCGMIVWLEWLQIYGAPPTGGHPGANHGQVYEATSGGDPYSIIPPGQNGS